MHLIDTMIRSGVQMGPMPLPSLPDIPGREVAGVVDAVGDGADGWLGRRVVAHLGPASRGYAELAVREVEHLHELPDGMPDDAAVAMIGTGRTAMAILDLARIEAGDVVLVTAAAGGLGTLLTQAARRAGARVIGAAGPGKPVTADVVVDYTVPGWADGLEEVTVVLDGVGGVAGRAALRAARPRRAPRHLRLVGRRDHEHHERRHRRPQPDRQLRARAAGRPARARGARARLRAHAARHEIPARRGRRRPRRAGGAQTIGKVVLVPDPGFRVTDIS